MTTSAYSGDDERDEAFPHVAPNSAVGHRYFGGRCARSAIPGGKAKLRQVDIAAALENIDSGQISRWERGRSAPSVLQLLRIGLRCNVRPETLIEGIVEPTWEQLTIGLDADAAAIVYDLAKALRARGRPVVLTPAPTDTTA